MIARVCAAPLLLAETKNQWARDDPAFVAILLVFLCVASLAFIVTFKAYGVGRVFRLFLGTVFVDFLAVGVLVASGCWFVCNRYLRIRQPSHHSVEQTVELLYAFDVHCNAFFPLFLMLYVLQLYLLPLLLRPGFVASLVADTLYASALSYYCYITFLGYNVLPFLDNTVIFLYPIVVIGCLYVLGILSGFNVSVFVMTRYFAV